MLNISFARYVKCLVMNHIEFIIKTCIFLRMINQKSDKTVCQDLHPLFALYELLQTFKTVFKWQDKRHIS